MADYRAQHTRKTKKNHTLPRAAATLAITAGLAVSPLLQTAAFAQDNAGANCGDACKNGTQADWDACKQQVTDAKAALDAAQKKADDAQAKVDAAEKEEARTLKLKNSYTTLAKKAQAAYDAVKDQPGKVDEAQKALDKAEADKKQAEQDYADAQAALEKAQADEQDAAKKQADAKADYEAALERYTEVKNLADQLAARENAYSKAVQAKEDATLKADAARAKVTEKAKEFDAAKQAYEDAKKAVADAEAALNDATANKAAAQQRLDAAKKALAKAQATYDAAKAAYDEAKASLDDAQVNLDKAVKAYDEALAAYKAAGNEWGDKLTSLQKTLDAKKADRDKAKSDLDRANKKLAAAQQDLEDWNGYKTAKVNPQLKKLQAAIEDAQAEVDEAQKGLDAANADVALAQQKVDSAQATYDAAQQQYAEAQAEYAKLEKATADAKAKAAEAEKLASQADALKQAKDNAYGAWVDYYYSTVEQAEKDYQDLKSQPHDENSDEWKAVVAKLTQIRQKYAELETVWKQADAAYQKAAEAQKNLPALKDAAEKAEDAQHEFFYREGTGVDALNFARQQAEKTLNDRKAELATAQQAAGGEQAKVDAAKKDLAAAKLAYAQKAAEVQEKEDGYVNAVNAAKASVKATQTAYDEAKEAAADAQADYDAAYAGAQAALKDLSQKLMDSETVKDEWTAAVEHFAKLTKTTEADRIAAAEALVSAKDEESRADNANAFAAQAVKDAQQALNTANYNAMQAQIHQMWTQLAYVAAGEEAAKAQRVLDAATETLLKAAEAREESRKAAIELPGLKAELDDLNWVYYAAQANYKKAAADLKKAEDAEKLALKRKNSFTTLWKEAVKALDAAKKDADAALIKAEATFDHIDGYFAKAGDLGINVAIPDTSDPVASDDFAGRLAILSTKLGQYAQVVAAAGTVYADAQTATADAKAELADAQDVLAKAQDAYDLAVACYNSCEEKGYHKAKAEEKKDEAKKPAEKKAEDKKELPATGDSSNGVAAGIAVAGVAAIAGAEVLRRRRAE